MWYQTILQSLTSVQSFPVGAMTPVKTYLFYPFCYNKYFIQWKNIFHVKCGYFQSMNEIAGDEFSCSSPNTPGVNVFM